jgi:hypothetical protein
MNNNINNNTTNNNNNPQRPLELTKTNQVIIGVVVAIVVVLVVLVIGILFGYVFRSKATASSIYSYKALSYLTPIAISFIPSIGFQLTNGSVYTIQNVSTGQFLIMCAGCIFNSPDIDRQCNLSGLVSTTGNPDKFLFTQTNPNTFVLQSLTALQNNIPSFPFTDPTTIPSNETLVCGTSTQNIVATNQEFIFTAITPIITSPISSFNPFSGTFIIQNIATGTYLRICNTPDLSCPYPVPTSSSAPPPSDDLVSSPVVVSDLTFGEASTDPIGQWIISLVG